MPVDWLIWIFLDAVTQYPITPRIIQESAERPRADFQLNYPVLLLLLLILLCIVFSDLHVKAPRLLSPGIDRSGVRDKIRDVPLMTLMLRLGGR